MNNNIQIRTVTVELLRAGPAYNQLLSPLTQYLGICGNSVAGIVTLPYEHVTFLRRMKAMRYEGEGVENQDRLGVLHDIGMDMAKVFGAIPTLPGALTVHSGEGAETLIHLRLTLSASELALLPFELAKMPAGPGGSDESWLVLQTRIPVCVTRHSRNVNAEDNQWPIRPRILFIASNPAPASIPFDAHREKLVAAVKPFLSPSQTTPTLSLDSRREQFGDWLTIIKDACFDEIVAECAENQYTHIHLLAHGDTDSNAVDTAYGLVLRKGEGNEVVSGERLACAFARIVTDKIHRPTVVTLATCDSGNVGSVLDTGASLAHALHLAGIPLVVASQFPLSKAGSVAVVGTLYQGLLWGKDPWILLHRIRSDLHAHFSANTHDWASLVVYEALPGNLAGQLEAVNYFQSKRANKAALEQMEQALPKVSSVPLSEAVEYHARLAQTVMGTLDKLPMDGKFNAECLGLKASSHKKLAQAGYDCAQAMGHGSSEYRNCLLQHYDELELARIDYQQAAKAFLLNEDKPQQHIAKLHWVLVQMLSIAAVLGKQPVRDGSWETAKLSAEAYLDHSSAEERAWAHGSLAELWLLHLADKNTPDTDADAAQAAKNHVLELINLFPVGDPFPIESTRKQFERYTLWWGQAAFADGLAEWGGEPRSSWDGAAGLIDTANAIIKLLTRRKLGPRTAVTVEAAALVEPIKPVNEAIETSKLGAASKLAAHKSPAAAPAFLEPASAGEPWLSIEMLPAGHGDCLWLQYGEGQSVSRVLLDCGTESTYEPLKQRVAQLPQNGRDFELFILSHIDADHIGGAIPFFNDQTLGVRFGDVWFNGWKHLPSDKLGAKQGEIFSVEIQKYKLPWNQWRNGGPIVIDGDELPVCTLPGGMRLTLLSPTQDKLATLAKKWNEDIKKLGLTPGQATDFEQFLRATPAASTDVDALADAPFKADAAPHNGSSIAVLAEYQGKSVLLGADAHAPVLVGSIQKLLKQRGGDRLKIGAFKVSHHASQNNINIELLKLLDCRQYLISTNGDHFNHPDREAVGRIIKYGGDHPTLYFNFRTRLNDVWEQTPLQETYGYQAIYPATGEAGLLVRL